MPETRSAPTVARGWGRAGFDMCAAGKSRPGLVGIVAGQYPDGTIRQADRVARGRAFDPTTRRLSSVPQWLPNSIGDWLQEVVEHDDWPRTNEFRGDHLADFSFPLLTESTRAGSG